MNTTAICTKLRRGLGKTPFQPFFLVLSDGQIVLVEYPEAINLTAGRSRRPQFKVLSQEFVELTVEYAAVRHVAPLTVSEAIAYAETVLPGTPSRKGIDPRWQAINLVGEFVRTEPRPIWEFIHRWGRHRQVDLRTAIAVCLLEHLLEYHFADYFPRVEQAALSSAPFGDTCLRIWKFGQSEESANSKRLDRLDEQIEKLRQHRKKKRQPR
ncbi:MAG: hypothetical protein WD872_19630 [Pirellulaceae bacterium]